MWLPSVDRMFDVTMNVVTNVATNASLTEVLVSIAVLWAFVMVRFLRV
jgi:hypothetical protein